jgi:hypothetical protein
MEAVSGQHWAALAGACFLTGLAGERLLAPAMEWLGNDPPDDDYRLSVRLKRSHLRPSDELDVEDAMVQHALQSFMDIDFAAAALRAMLRAAEREQAADLAEDAYTAERRVEEGVHFRALAINGLNATAHSCRTLADDQRQLQSANDGGLGRQRRRRRFQRDARRLLGFSGTAGTLTVAADACQVLAEDLGRW